MIDVRNASSVITDNDNYLEASDSQLDHRNPEVRGGHHKTTTDNTKSSTKVSNKQHQQTSHAARIPLNKEKKKSFSYKANIIDDSHDVTKDANATQHVGNDIDGTSYTKSDLPQSSSTISGNSSDGNSLPTLNIAVANTGKADYDRNSKELNDLFDSSRPQSASLTTSTTATKHLNKNADNQNINDSKVVLPSLDIKQEAGSSSDKLTSIRSNFSLELVKPNSMQQTRVKKSIRLSNRFAGVILDDEKVVILNNPDGFLCLNTIDQEKFINEQLQSDNVMSLYQYQEMCLRHSTARSSYSNGSDAISSFKSYAFHMPLDINSFALLDADQLNLSSRATTPGLSQNTNSRVDSKRNVMNRDTSLHNLSSSYSKKNTISSIPITGRKRSVSSKSSTPSDNRRLNLTALSPIASTSSEGIQFFDTNRMPQMNELLIGETSYGSNSRVDSAMSKFAGNITNIDFPLSPFGLKAPKVNPRQYIDSHFGNQSVSSVNNDLLVIFAPSKRDRNTDMTGFQEYIQSDSSKTIGNINISQPLLDSASVYTTSKAPITKSINKVNLSSQSIDDSEMKKFIKNLSKSANPILDLFNYFEPFLNNVNKMRLYQTACVSHDVLSHENDIIVKLFHEYYPQIEKMNHVALASIQQLNKIEFVVNDLVVISKNLNISKNSDNLDEYVSRYHDTLRELSK